MVQDQLGLRVGSDIALPVVDLKEATKTAKQGLYERRYSTEVKAGKQAVVDKHASRKNWGKQTRTRRTSVATTTDKQQLGFDF